MRTDSFLLTVRLSKPRAKRRVTGILHERDLTVTGEPTELPELPDELVGAMLHNTVLAGNALVRLVASTGHQFWPRWGNA